MTVQFNDSGDLVYVDSKGNEIEIDVQSSYCEACCNTHLDFSIPVFSFISEDNKYFGDYEYFDEHEFLNDEIEEHLRTSPPQHIS